jgi:hypothetical protein
MAPDISKVDANGHLNRGTSAWNFRDKVMRRLLHREQPLPSGRPAHLISWYQFEMAGRSIAAKPSSV